VRRTLVAALVLFFASAAIANAQTVTGGVDSTGVHSGIRATTVFRIRTARAITAALGWRSSTAVLDLYLARQRRDGTWRRVGRAVSPTAHPKHLRLADAPAGRYRLKVRAVSGRTRFRLRFTTAPPARPAARGPFLTLLFSRTETGTARRCVPDGGGYAGLLSVVAPALAARHIAATGSVETGIIEDRARACVHYGRSLVASWTDMRRLRDGFGWSFVSHGRTWATHLASMTPAQQWSDTCGSLLDLERHGFWSGDGLFAFPDNRWNAAVQTSVVSTCFAFGRRYGAGPTERSSATRSPYWQRTEGISGGRCNDRARPCAELRTLTTYRSPRRVRRQIAALQPNQWLTLQSYVLVTGNRPGAWHCSGRDWRDHWTIDPERYCWRDYRRIIEAIPRFVAVTDPKSVARAWGRTGYRPPTP
jgi:hypothetical protein